MKTTPTDLDREAATMFSPSGGMLFLSAAGNWRRAGKGTIALWDQTPPHGRERSNHRPVAIDTDDPATVGVMVAQVRAAGDPTFHVAPLAAGEFQVCWLQDEISGHVFESEGAALVAAMRVIRASPPPGKLPNGRSEPR